MPQQMTGVLVLIASPGDTVDERIAVSEALADWNVVRGRRQGAAGRDATGGSRDGSTLGVARMDR